MEEVSEFPAGPLFIRGDCNTDGAVDIADSIFELNVLFGGQGPEACSEACDANDDEAFDIADAIYVLTFLFSMGSPPPLPFPDCGVEPVPAGILGCTNFPPCP